MLAGVVRHDDHHAPDDAGVGEGHQGVRGDVEPHALHRDEAAGAGDGGAGGGLEGHLFIRRPLAVDAFGRVGDEGFQDFGGRRAGVAEGGGCAGLVGAAGDGLVAGEEDHGCGEVGVRDCVIAGGA